MFLKLAIMNVGGILMDGLCQYS